jgi:hypothetical protein
MPSLEGMGTVCSISPTKLMASVEAPRYTVFVGRPSGVVLALNRANSMSVPIEGDHR